MSHEQFHYIALSFYHKQPLISPQYLDDPFRKLRQYSTRLVQTKLTGSGSTKRLRKKNKKMWVVQNQIT